MRLRDLLSADVALDGAASAIAATGIATDSRAVKPGDVFFALAGSKTDGSKFIARAIEKGAVAIVADRASASSVPVIVVTNPRRALALASAAFFAKQPGTIAAVTGTSGKTSVAAFVRQIWEKLGHASASLGTIGIVAPKRTVYGSLTTPDPIALHRSLAELADEGVTHLALEASSHGLDQHRLDGVRVAAGGFTNLSRDHMDYHPTVEHYLGAKLRLFSDLVADGGAAVVAADHEHSAAVCEVARKRGLKLMTVGRNGDGIRLADAQVDGFAQILKLKHGGKDYSVRLPLVGEFQIENALVAAGLVIGTGGAAAKVFAALEQLEGAPGRLEFIGERNGAPVFVDYAHKPDALEKTLAALRPYATRKLVVVFGAGGDRDAGKRPLMGDIAARGADSVIVTDDNPRSENPAAIRAAIMAAAPGAREIGDRAEAIRAAVDGLQAGDALVIAGKGHETGQIVGDKVLPFSDHEAAQAALGGGRK
ncbi:MAG: UDP-N-acetylmuramoyl-L-alanyl-D-glutamate--2,6-diaminopimelate ligase [Proteobacteria bacterium SG_bin9]|nr:MAG: UDP-N-acetylmuramoyl-L-alanyl-D-glutamate--2,6-diaminopimelate ligase [Proteobacteria bacterium SG_bin9]